jgi:hypothetical protein
MRADLVLTGGSSFPVPESELPSSSLSQSDSHVSIFIVRASWVPGIYP